MREGKPELLSLVAKKNQILSFIDKILRNLCFFFIELENTAVFTSVL